MLCAVAIYYPLLHWNYQLLIKTTSMGTWYYYTVYYTAVCSLNIGISNEWLMMWITYSTDSYSSLHSINIAYDSIPVHISTWLSTYRYMYTSIQEITVDFHRTWRVLVYSEKETPWVWKKGPWSLIIWYRYCSSIVVRPHVTPDFKICIICICVNYISLIRDESTEA